MATTAGSGLVQYVVLRSDLKTVLQWPLGALIAQAAHATAAVTHLFHDDPNTQQYLADLDNMHKVVLEVWNVLLWPLLTIKESYGQQL